MPQDSLSAWYADFFTEIPNAFWRAAVPPEMTTAEVTRLVAEAGFGRISLYGDTDTTPFRLGSPRLLLVAQLTEG